MNLIKLLALSFAFTQATPCAANPVTDAFASTSEFCYQEGSYPVLAAINAGGFVALAAAAKYVYGKELSGKELKQLIIDAKNNPKQHKLLIAIASILLGFNGNFVGQTIAAKSSKYKKENKNPKNDPVENPVVQKTAQEKFNVILAEQAKEKENLIQNEVFVIEEAIAQLKTKKSYQGLTEQEQQNAAAFLEQYKEQRALIHALQEQITDFNSYGPEDGQLHMLTTKKQNELQIYLLRLTTDNTVLITKLEALHLIKKNKDNQINPIGFEEFEILSDEEYLKTIREKEHQLEKKLLEIDQAVNELANETETKRKINLTDNERATIENEYQEKRQELRVKGDQIRDKLKLNDIKKVKAQGKTEEA